jgi:hypothetical protein
MANNHAILVPSARRLNTAPLILGAIGTIPLS